MRRKRIKKVALRSLYFVLVPVLLLHIYALSLRFVPPPGTILMMQRASSDETIQKDWTPIEEISPHLVYAVIAAEDNRFCEHGGVDWRAVETVREEHAAGKSRRGGSTITQQTAKNVFLWNRGGWVRKLPETWLALFTDKAWGKRRTMEIYLNVAEWGNGIFGAEAAAQVRFGKPAKNLTQQEAALLAAVLPNPNKWRVDPPGPYVTERAGGLVKRAAVVKNSGYASCVFK